MRQLRDQRPNGSPNGQRSLEAAALTLALLMNACGGGSADSLDPPPPEPSRPEPGFLEPGTYESQGGDCSGPAEQCGARDWCYVINSWERLDESGCLHQHIVPVGCVVRRDDSVVQEVVTEARGPDGACWTFPNSGVPVEFERSAECEERIRQAALCSD